MKVTLVGCGMQGINLLEQAIEELPVTKAAVVDTDEGVAESVRKHFRRFIEVDEEDGGDLVIIATPSYTHREVAQRYPGVDLYVEKPVALSASDLEWFEDRGNYKVGYQCRFVPGVQEILATQLEGIEAIKCWKVRPRPSSYYNDWHGKWATDGGVLTQQGIHCVDLVCLMAGFKQPLSVSMMGFRRRHQIEAEDTAEVVIDYGDFEAQVTCTTAGPSSFSGLLVRDHWKGSFLTEGFEFESLTTGDAQWAQEKSIWHEDTPHATQSMWIAHAAYASWDHGGLPMGYGSSYGPLGSPL